MRSRFVSALLRPVVALGLVGAMLGTSVPAFAAWDWEEDFAPDLSGAVEVLGSDTACANDGSDLEGWMNDLLDAGTAEAAPQASCDADLIWS